jgi:hypothetical protein
VGIDSRTSVDELYRINRVEDFDEYLSAYIVPFPHIGPLLARYRRFAALLRRSNVFITSFDGGFLSSTRLRFLEHVFLRIGGKKLILWPYGSDTYVPSAMHDTRFRDGLLRDYPGLAVREEQTLRQIDYFSKHADCIVGNVPHDESLPRKDVLTIACYCVDTEHWAPDGAFRHVGDGSSAKPPVRIFHCPNHRNVKGTPHLLAAFAALRAEGFNVELEIAENVSNEEIRIRMRQADIVAAQFLYGYASTEIEGMSLAKPVVSNLANDHYYAALREKSFLRYSPIVSATPETLHAILRELVTDTSRRETLGTQGRAYVERFHSFAAQATFWRQVICYSLGEITDAELSSWWTPRPDASAGAD